MLSFLFFLLDCKLSLFLQCRWLSWTDRKNFSSYVCSSFFVGSLLALSASS